MPKEMSEAQRDYIEKLASKHDLSDADLDELAEDVTGFPGATWKELNIGQASNLLDKILEEYGGFD